MVKRKTYGKKRIEQSALTLQCFGGTGSSSPAKADLTLHSTISVHSSLSQAGDARITTPPDSPSRNTRNQCRTRAREKAGHEDLEAKDGLPALVEDMTCLSISPGRHKAGGLIDETVSREKQNESRTILQSRDANIVRDEYTTRRPKAETLADSAETLLSDLENLGLGDNNVSSTNLTHNSPNHSLETTLPAARRHQNIGDDDITPLDEYSLHTKPLLALCSDCAGKTSPTRFQDWADDLSQFFTIRKIAEASYGEVYRLSVQSSDSGIGKEEESVLKLIALKPPQRPGATEMVDSKAKAKEEKKILAMSAVEDVASEVRLLRHMSAVPGFTNFREVRVVQGRLPRQFITAWKQYNKHVKKSLFPDPSRKANYREDQLWAVVEMQDAGTDLETLMENLPEGEGVSVWTVWDVFWSVACAVAKGEEWTGFEHRDLHLGNICVRPTNPSTDSILNLDTKLLSLDATIGYTGLETTLIDYTLSRADIGNSEDNVAFFDLSKDPAIFEGDGDVDYQYDMYRAMRAVVLSGSPEEEPSQQHNSTREDWKQPHSMTNLVWLHFVLFKLMSNMSNAISDLDAERRICKLNKDLRGRLKQLEKALSIDSLVSSGLQRTADLVAWAMELGWLAEEDVIGLNGSNDESGLIDPSPLK